MPWHFLSQRARLAAALTTGIARFSFTYCKRQIKDRRQGDDFLPLLGCSSERGTHIARAQSFVRQRLAFSFEPADLVIDRLKPLLEWFCYRLKFRGRDERDQIGC